MLFRMWMYSLLGCARKKKKESQLVPLDKGSESSVGWGSQDWYSFTPQQRREVLHSRSLFRHVDLQLVRSLTSTLTRYSCTPVSGLNRTLFLPHVLTGVSDKRLLSEWWGVSPLPSTEIVPLFFTSNVDRIMQTFCRKRPFVSYTSPQCTTAEAGIMPYEKTQRT